MLNKLPVVQFGGTVDLKTLQAHGVAIFTREHQDWISALKNNNVNNNNINNNNINNIIIINNNNNNNNNNIVGHKFISYAI